MEPIYTSGTTRCPKSDSDIFFTWDVRNGNMRAAVSANAAARKQAVQDARSWCSSFNLRQKHFDTLREASRFVERYDTWFMTA